MLVILDMINRRMRHTPASEFPFHFDVKVGRLLESLQQGGNMARPLDVALQVPYL